MRQRALRRGHNTRGAQAPAPQLDAPREENVKLEVYGLPVATATFGIAGTVLGLMSVPVGAGVAVSGMIVVAALDIVGRVRADADARAAEARALERVAEAARRLRKDLAAGMPLGGTTVP